VSDVWTPWDPEGSRPGDGPGQEGPDPEPIVRQVRIGFLFAGILVAAMVHAGLTRMAGERIRGAGSLAVTASAAVLVVAILGVAAWALRPSRLLVAGKQALRTSDPRERRPRAERARAMGFRGLAMGWAGQAVLLGLIPAAVGLVLQVMHGYAWELFAFAGLSLLAGLVFQREVSDAVRLAVNDPELRDSYGAG
jgi:hypothetical protein